MTQGLLQEPQNIAEEEEEMCEDAQSPTSQGIPKEPAHSSETETAELQGSADGNGHEITITQ